VASAAARLRQWQRWPALRYQYRLYKVLLSAARVLAPAAPAWADFSQRHAICGLKLPVELAVA